jgi:hypothetical protein
MLLAKSQNNDLNILIRGGLGNQLFMYCAGAYLADRLNRRLVLCFMKDKINNEVPLSTFLKILPSDTLEIGHSFTLSGRHKLEEIASRNTSLFSRYYVPFFESYEQNGIGYDGNLDFLSNVVYLKGYFQSYRYFDSLRNSSNSRVNFQFSQESHSAISAFAHNLGSDHIALHVRLGDYKDFAKSFGILSNGYYVNGIATIIAREKLANPKIFVFTNELDAAKTLLQGFPFKLDWSVSESDLKPLETILLFSKFQYKIIANSTFSWWGAMLGEKDSIVVSPSKWFKAMKDPVDISPHYWIRNQSLWNS